MLAFIADIDDQLLSSAATGDGRVTVAALYQRLILEWLDSEGRAGVTEVFGPTSLDGLWQAVTYLAWRLWVSGETALGADALGAAADILTRLTGARDAASLGRNATARLLGTGTLLTRDHEYRFHFVDYSILQWLVAREIAGHLHPDRPPGRLRVLLRREMSPLMVEFVCDLAGHNRARSWAEAALADPASPEEVFAAARRILDHLLKRKQHADGERG
jgi:hypothetical protein